MRMKDALVAVPSVSSKKDQAGMLLDIEGQIRMQRRHNYYSQSSSDVFRSPERSMMLSGPFGLAGSVLGGDVRRG